MGQLTQLKCCNGGIQALWEGWAREARKGSHPFHETAARKQGALLWEVRGASSELVGQDWQVNQHG